MKLLHSTMLASASLLALSSTAYAQSTGSQQGSTNEQEADDGFSVEEIIVTARRKEERLLDVPLTVNAVTSEDLNRLNIRRFEDIQSIVPGLSLTPGGSRAGQVGASASVRGVNFDAAASGNNGTIEFYLNDAPILAENLFQVMFDVGQIELLRGPQGTLRGRASPSGSMTVTTRRPELSEFGGYVNTTATDIGGQNANAALNIPIVNDMLAVRIAALYDENEGTRVESVRNSLDPFVRTKAGRASVRFEPTASLSFDATYQYLEQSSRTYNQIESVSVINPTSPTSPVFIDGDDLRAAQDTPAFQDLEYENLNLRAQWAFAGQRVNYAGAINEREIFARAQSDVGDFFGPTFPAYLQNWGQIQDGHTKQRAHELRLSSEERVFGMLDYIVGGFYQKLDAPTDLLNATALVAPAPNPGILLTPIQRRGGNKEQSYFGNLTLHVSDALEISGGLRYIEYEATGALFVNGARNPGADQDDEFDTTIYSGSVKYKFTDDLMAYANVGTSWRAGLSVVGDFSLNRSPLENSFLLLPPEESDSYEIGFKASALDNRLNVNVSLFHQEFDNYPFRVPGTGVFYVETFLNTRLVPPAADTRVTPFNFVGAVPVDVNGIEVELAFAPTDRWSIGTTASYAKSEIQGGLIPCNDYFPRDGVPDASTSIPTREQIRAATNGDNLSGCVVDYRASLSPLWSASLQSEYRIPVSSRMDVYVRGLASFYGDSQNDPTNTVDDTDSYSLLNLYLGVRDPNGAWEVSLYGKNVTETERVLSRTNGPLTTPFNGINGVTTYRQISFTPPREFGINLRYAFGSR